VIVKVGSEWCVKSEDGKRSFGCYPSEDLAKKRLHQIEGFKHMGDQGDWIEIFEAGTHRGKTYTEADLDAMVANFAAHRDRIKPPLKLGHDDEQQAAKLSGLPAVGWLDELKRMGTKLVARFRDVPRVVKEAVRRRLYKRMSAEIYTDIGQVVKGARGMALRAVALVDIPEVKTLQDILALAETLPAVDAFDDSGADVLVVEYEEHPQEGSSGPDNGSGTDTDTKGSVMSDALATQVERLSEQNGELRAEMKRLSEQLDTLQAEKADVAEKFGEASDAKDRLTAELTAKKAAITALEAEVTKHSEAATDATKKLDTFKAEVDKAERESYLDSASKAGKLTKVEREHFSELWTSNKDLVKKLIDLRKENSAVKLSEEAPAGAAPESDGGTPAEGTKLTENQVSQMANKMIADGKAKNFADAVIDIRKHYEAHGEYETLPRH